MEQFFGFALPGIPYGCTYALVAVCLVLTYQATGVFNFAFGAQAFASAFVFTYLTEYHAWSGFEAFLVSVVVHGPGDGMGLRSAASSDISRIRTRRRRWCAASRSWSGSRTSSR